jgi:uncharacterized membrane protein YeaQ/YmgE (transglycosylase-associated protein family)
MSIIAWTILGLTAGFLASKQGHGVVRDILLGIVGALVGGWLFHFFGAVGAAGFNPYSMVLAMTGAVGALAASHAVRQAIYRPAIY